MSSELDGIFHSSFDSVAAKLASTARALETFEYVYEMFIGVDATSFRTLEFKAELIKRYDVTAYGDALFVVRKWPKLVKKRSRPAAVTEPASKKTRKRDKK